MTDAELASAIMALDKRSNRGERTDLKADLAPHGAKSGKSAYATGELVAMVKELDKRRARGGDRGNQHTGGKPSRDGLPATAAT